MEEVIKDNKDLRKIQDEVAKHVERMADYDEHQIKTLDLKM